MDQKMIIGVVVAAIVAGGAGYLMGSSHSSVQAPTGSGQYGGAGMQGGGGQGGRRFGGNNSAMGTIVSIDGQSITVQLGGPNASSTNGTNTGTKLVLVGSSTQVGKFVEGSIGDLAQGDVIMANGTPNSDGSLTASMIQIRPQGGMMGGPRGGGQPGQ